MLRHFRSGKLPRHHWIYPILTTLAILVMAARITSTYRVFNDTIDEPYHIGAGIGLLEAHKHIEGVQHPPLARLVAALALYLGGVTYPPDRGLSTIQDDLHAFDVGHYVLLQSALPYWHVLTAARAAMLIFPILSVAYVYWLGRYLGGPLVGCLAAIAFSTDPTLLAHGGVVTTDVAAVAGFLAAIYHGLRFIARPGPARGAIAGVAFGLAVACKFSCLLAAPALAILLVLRRRRALRRFDFRSYFRAWPRPRSLTLAMACAFLSLWATYLFDLSPLQDSRTLASTPAWDAIPAWLKPIPIPMPSAILGGIRLIQHDRMGHAAYLNGEIRNGSWWFYFPEAIAIKSPASLIGATLLALACALFIRPSPRAGAAFIPFAVFLLVSMNSGLNIGVRHVLPAVALLDLLVIQQLLRVKLASPACVVIILMFVETLCLHPDYLAFFNVLAGGPRNGESYLLDSNLDWGQDQARLAQWLDRNARGRTVTLRIFGNPRLRQWPHWHYDLLPEGAAPRGLLAVSKNFEHDLARASYIDAQGRVRLEPDLSWVLRLKPAARIGYSIDVFDLDSVPLP